MSIAQRMLVEHAGAIARGARCTECPLFKKAIEDGQNRGPVMGQIRSNSKLVIIGEAPGNREVDSGIPFTGATGRIVNSKLFDGGLSRDHPSDVSLTNTILCQPPTDYESYEDKLRARAKAAGREAVLPTDCCRPRLETDLAEANATVEYAVGRQALAALARHYNVPYGRETRKRQRGDISIASLRKQHGAPIIVRKPDHPEGAKVLIASYHPAYAMRGAKAWMPVIKTVIERAARIASRGGDILWSKPAYILDPTLDQIEAFVEEAIATGRVVMVDIETGPSKPGADDGGSIQTCALRAIGWGFRRDNGDEVIMVVPYRDMDGSHVWHAAQYRRLDAAIIRLMNEAYLAGQNLSFDSAVLLRLGLMTNRKKRWTDVMLGHHNTDSNDLPHDLGFIISEHFEAPHHKHDVDHKSVDNVDYGMLKEYCADDVLTQLRCLTEVLKRVSALGTVEQFKTDTKLAPIVRDMGDLGLVIDEHERQRLATVLLERLDHFRAKVRFEVALILQDDAEVKRVEAKLACMRQDRHGPEFWARAYQEYASLRGYGEFNPNSVPQLRDLFFNTLDLTPILNTDGYEFDIEADDDPSTSQAAILKLMEKYTHIHPLCDALLEFRAYNKLYGTYVADKKGRIRDVDWTKWGLPPNIAKRVLNTIYKVHVIPSGRLSTQPAIQNWPALGKANMRTMVVAPDGHCIVGADYDQLELRIYAVVAQDQLLLEAFTTKDKFGNPIDPHSLNAAALLSDTDGGIWDQYYHIKYDMSGKERKYWRTVAKRFTYLECIAEGSLVLTPRGEVPIEEVTTDDLVWDGVEWVRHEGLLARGLKEVVTHDGVTATSDHKVWLEDGTTTSLGNAKRQRRRLCRSGRAGRPVRIVDSIRASGWSDVGAVCLRHNGCSHTAFPNFGAFDPMSFMRLTGSDSGRPTIGAPHDRLQAALHQSKRYRLGVLRWTRDRISFFKPACSRPLGDGKSRVRARHGDRPYRQRGALRPGQSTFGDASGQYAQPTLLEATTRFRVSHTGLALCRGRRSTISTPRTDTGTGSRKRTQGGNREEKGVATHRRLVRVYDLLNAGPRRRFTVDGRLVSNCYGGEEDKLYATMAASRDKSTGRRDFPNLQPKDVELWHKRWHRLHPETKRWQDNCKYIAYNRGHVRVGTLDFRARFWPGGIDKKNAPPNHTIQGFAASIANKALIDLSEAIPYRGWSMVSGLNLQVHDYIGAYVPRERVWEAVGLFKECLEYTYKGMDFTCSPEASYRWSEQG